MKDGTVEFKAVDARAAAIKEERYKAQTEIMQQEA